MLNDKERFINPEYNKNYGKAQVERSFARPAKFV